MLSASMASIGREDDMKSLPIVGILMLAACIFTPRYELSEWAPVTATGRDQTEIFYQCAAHADQRTFGVFMSTSCLLCRSYAEGHFEECMRAHGFKRVTGRR